MSRSLISSIPIAVCLLLSIAAAGLAATVDDEDRSAPMADDECRTAPSSPAWPPTAQLLTEAPAGRMMPAGSVTPACGNCPACWVDLVDCRTDCRRDHLPDPPALAACLDQCVNLYCGCTAYACPGPPPV